MILSEIWLWVVFWRAQIPIRGEDNTWVAAFGGPEKRASLKGKQVG